LIVCKSNIAQDGGAFYPTEVLVYADRGLGSASKAKHAVTLRYWYLRVAAIESRRRRGATRERVRRAAKGRLSLVKAAGRGYRVAAVWSPPVCRFSDAGKHDFTTRHSRRRPKSAKPPNRGKERRPCRRLWDFAAGSGFAAIAINDLSPLRKTLATESWCSRLSRGRFSALAHGWFRVKAQET
jgi:hypothetical protein